MPAEPLAPSKATYLQYFPSDVLLTALTLDSKHGVVIHLAVGDPIPVWRTQENSQLEYGPVIM